MLAVTLDRPSDILGEAGGFAAALDGYRPRQAQMEMADRVAAAIDQHETLVVEAGTGIGKTFAYLVPALLSGERVIISTGTKNLQDQLFHRDLPLVRQVLGGGGKSALLKGRTNYLCLHRLYQTESQGRFNSRKEAASFVKIRHWADRTRQGDIAEMSRIDEGSPLWGRVTSSSDNCLGQECDYWDGCFVVQARREAQQADVVVVNHHLFFADMALKEEGVGELLPGANAVIFDEAHQLGGIATAFFGEQLGSRQLMALADDTVAAYLAHCSHHKPLQQQAEQLKQRIADLRLSFNSAEHARLGRYPWKEITGSAVVDQATAQLQRSLQGLRRELEVVAACDKELELALERCKLLTESLERLTSTAPPGQIHWIELHERTLSIHHTPLEISENFQTFIQGQECGWIFTSATLAIEGRFDHFLSEFGIEGAATAQWQSPFDYSKQALFYHPQGLPPPGDPGYTRAMMEQMLPVIEASKGRTFLLFTSHRALREAAEFLRQQSLDYPLLVQGEGARTHLLERFRQEGNALLLGAASFWEGVDVRGDALSCVIIDKFPFASPGDPVLQARIDAMRLANRNPFIQLQLPRAVILLRQGAGRLIRAVDDRGVFVVCDPRLLKKGYGHTFLNSLPEMARTRELEQVVNFCNYSGIPVTDSDCP